MGAACITCAVDCPEVWRSRYNISRGCGIYVVFELINKIVFSVQLSLLYNPWDPVKAKRVVVDVLSLNIHIRCNDTFLNKMHDISG